VDWKGLMIANRAKIFIALAASMSAGLLGYTLLSLKVPNKVYIENEGLNSLTNLRLFYTGGVTTIPILKGLQTKVVTLNNLKGESGLGINFQDPNQKEWADSFPVYLEASSYRSVHLSIDSNYKVRWLDHY